MNRRSLLTFAAATLAFAISGSAYPQRNNIASEYEAIEYMIPMRDGVKLYTLLFVPNKPGNFPMMMERTGYGAGSPGGGPRRASQEMHEAGYIWASQDVRGKGKSEGDFVSVTPPKRGKMKTDESTDTWDTMEYLIKHAPRFSGRVGLRGISYPGFYTAASAINTHPAIKAISPQAPVTNWFLGDDVHHNGVLFLQETFDFVSGFNVPRGGQRPEINRGDKSAYDFFLESGPISTFDSKHLKGLVPYWNTDIMAHSNYDAYWKERALERNFKNVKCAVLTVGGFFDKEDMWGAQNLYANAEKQNKGIPNFVVLGPWSHGGWAGGPGSSLGDISFGTNTSEYYRKEIEFPFFEKYLRDAKVAPPAEANVFETGANQWHKFDVWPPKNLKAKDLYLGQDGKLETSAPTTDGSARYVSNPFAPTPYLANFETSRRAPGDWLIYDQRYFETRSDVLTYRTPMLSEPQQIVGPVYADLWITTTGTDADFVVKVIDEYPADTTETYARDPKKSMAGYQMMVRSDVFRAKFRDSFEKPKPVVPGQPTRVRFKLNETMHTFRPGHRIVVQVQSSWFPIADRNPNTFVDIAKATESDFQKARITILSTPKYPSKVQVMQLPKVSR